MSNYQKRIEEGITQIEELRNNRFIEDYTKETEICLSKIVKIITENISLLKEKIKTPSLVVSISSLNECEKEINAIIEKANDKIKVYNEKIDNVQESLKTIKSKFWKLMKKQYFLVFTLYETAKNTYMEDEEKYKKKFEQIVKDINLQQVIIAEKKEVMSESMSEFERTRMQVVLGYLNTNKEISSAIAAELLGVEVKTASRLLLKAEKLNILKGEGKTKSKVYLRE